MSEKHQIDLIAKELLDLFPEAKQTMRDRLPTAMILTAAILDIRASIRDIKFSAEELRESILGFVAMIPDELKDDAFMEELQKSKQFVAMDVRPRFNETPASDEYCKRKGIPTVQYVETFDYLAVFHACFNLLNRKRMLLQVDAKEIFDGTKAIEESEPE